MRRVFLSVSAGLLVLIFVGTLSPLMAQDEMASDDMAAMAEMMASSHDHGHDHDHSRAPLFARRVAEASSEN